MKDDPNFARQSQQNMIFAGHMIQHISTVTLLIPDYDKAIAFYVGRLVEDTALSATKRWMKRVCSSPKLIRPIKLQPSAIRQAGGFF